MAWSSKLARQVNFLHVHRSNGKDNRKEPRMLAKALVRIGSGGAQMESMLELPHASLGIVLFAHGSGSSRLSPRNNYVARVLREAGIGTLLLDLLTPDEEPSPAARFDIALLAALLRTATDWLRAQDATLALPLGLFGASTGAAAALQLAADPGCRWRRWSRAATGPTWPARRCCIQWERRPCSSSGATTMASST